MPSFDIVSKVNAHEIHNAVDQANREVSTRFDFKGTDAHLELAEEKITLVAETEFQLQQMNEILLNKLAKRQVDLAALQHKPPTTTLKLARQEIVIQQGIQQETAKSIIKSIKDKKLKVQAAIQGDQVRVTGKKRDDLQEVIQFLKQKTFDLPLQFENFRD